MAPTRDPAAASRLCALAHLPEPARVLRVLVSGTFARRSAPLPGLALIAFAAAVHTTLLIAVLRGLDEPLALRVREVQRKGGGRAIAGVDGPW